MGKGSKDLDPSLPNDDQEEGPLMTTTSSSPMPGHERGKRQYTWEEIRRHSKKTDRWLVIDKRVYDVTRWVKHPGGQVVLNHYAGQDATVGERRGNQTLIVDLVDFVGSVSSFACWPKSGSEVPQAIIHRWCNQRWRRGKEKCAHNRRPSIERRLWKTPPESCGSGEAMFAHD